MGKIIVLLLDFYWKNHPSFNMECEKYWAEVRLILALKYAMRTVRLHKLTICIVERFMTIHDHLKSTQLSHICKLSSQ